MNHYPKFSLILLIPFSIIASSPENKSNKGIVFIPKGKTDANPRGMLTSTNPSLLTPTNSMINTYKINRGADESTNELDNNNNNNNNNNNKPEAAQPSLTSTTDKSNNDLNDNLVLVDLPAQSEDLVNHNENIVSNYNELGMPYSRTLAPEQNNIYVVGRDGISKFLKRESSSTYINRLVTAGNFAGAARNSTDSYLPDHLRRTIESKQEELAEKSEADKNITLELLKKQRVTNTKQFSELSVLFDATTKHASTDITLSTIEAFIQKIISIQASKKTEANTIAQEFAEQVAALEGLLSQAKALKQAQSSQAATQSSQADK